MMNEDQESELDYKSSETVCKLPHHVQQSLCMTRPPYRQGRKLTAVKAYSINDESSYIIISSVPDIKIEKELRKMCFKYGRVDKIKLLPDYPHHPFEVSYLVKYQFIKNARIAKRILDGKNFFGGILHVCYAPELESVEETQNKLKDRKSTVAFLNSKHRNIHQKHSNQSESDIAIKRVMKRIKPELGINDCLSSTLNPLEEEIQFHDKASSVIEDNSQFNLLACSETTSENHESNFNIDRSENAICHSQLVDASYSSIDSFSNKDTLGKFTRVNSKKNNRITSPVVIEKDSILNSKGIFQKKKILSNKIKSNLSTGSKHKKGKLKFFPKTIIDQPSLTDLLKPINEGNIKL